MSQSQARSEAQSAGDVPAFELKRSQFLKTLNITVEAYEHTRTGAYHYHLASDNPENVFLVALRTVPMDSRGVAHILEHTALCGSERFPVRDPFFTMIRRSMNTFMNAFTSSDWTAYPFASQNLKDFNNLLEVYLDAVFFSNLHELDFAQEGHRLEFSEADNPESALEYRGVVYNEMKGAMSSPSSWIWHQLSENLFPTTTYHYNSGGDPAQIPDLTYQQLLDFYRVHYHPSNAVFMTFGNIPAADHQRHFEELVLSRFDRLDVHVAVGDEQRYSEPVEVEAFYPLDEEDASNKTHIVMAWLLGQSTNLEALYRAQLLAGVLLDNSASPLLQALETTDLGRAPSPLCGLEDSQREMSFICGLEGCADDATEAVKTLILETLEKVAREGIAQDKVEAALHTLELHQREISGDGFPYGLQLIVQSLSATTHRGDPIDLLDIEPVLARLKEDIRDPNFIPNLIRSELLDNPHRVTLTSRPDQNLSEQRNQAERDKLAALKESLSPAEKQEIIQQTKRLNERQQQEDDISILPKVELSDVPADINWPEAVRTTIDTGKRPTTASFYGQGTNGLAYQQVVLPLPALPESLQALLPLYSSCLPEVGVGDRSYLDIQSLQSAISGGIGARVAMRSAVDDEQQLSAHMILSSKGLYRNQAALAGLMAETLHEARFDEHRRIREIVEHICSRREQSITQQGHSLAMGLASSRMSPIAAYEFRQGGLAGVSALKTLTRSFDETDAVELLCQQLAELHQHILQAADRQFLLIAEADEQQALLEAVTSAWQVYPLSDSQSEGFSLAPIRESTTAAWITSTQVHFCAKAYPTVPASHEDAAALTVLGGFLRNGFLHRAIREQGGAYGGGATQDSGSASFRFFSYRDPRLEGTLADFDASISWLMEQPHDAAQVEEAILGVISSLDKPASPAGTAKQAFYNELFGRSREHRAKFRQRVLEVDLAALRRVAELYLRAEQASTGIITHREGAAGLPADRYEITTL